MMKRIILLRMRHSDVKMDMEEKAGMDREGSVKLTTQFDAFRQIDHSICQRASNSPLNLSERQSGRNACRLSGDACGLPAPSSLCVPVLIRGMVSEGRNRKHKPLGACLGSPRLKPSIKACCPGER